MSLERLKRDWDDLAEVAPYWAVLTDLPKDMADKPDLDAFFRTGAQEIADLMQAARVLGLPARRNLALDFGSGLGRLTRSLAAHFERVFGLDISETMIAQAKRLNADVANAEFVLNPDPHLGLYPDGHFDLIYSARVLQHLPNRRTIEAYLAEFVRVLRPGGLLVFQLPTYIPFRHRLQPRRRLYVLLRTLGFEEHLLFNRLGLASMQMTYIPQTDTTAHLAALGATLLRSHPDDMCGPSIKSRTYYLTR